MCRINVTWIRVYRLSNTAEKEAMKNYISANAAYLNEGITNFKNMLMFQHLENIQNNKIRKKYQPRSQLPEATTISFWHNFLQCSLSALWLQASGIEKVFFIETDSNSFLGDEHI